MMGRGDSLCGRAAPKSDRELQGYSFVSHHPGCSGFFRDEAAFESPMLLSVTPDSYSCKEPQKTLVHQTRLKQSPFTGALSGVNRRLFTSSQNRSHSKGR